MARAPSKGSNSPWGKIQTVEVIVPGDIWEVTTAGHGGIKVSRRLQAQIPGIVRSQDGWYEEDVCWAVPAMTFPYAFEDWHAGIVEIAYKTMKEYYPEECQQLTKLA